MTKVLHITNWYPNIYNKFEAQFIKEHISSIETKVNQEIWHLQVRQSEKIFKIEKGHYLNSKYVFVCTRITNQRIVDILYMLLMIYLAFIIMFKRKKFDIINIHICYPLLAYFFIFKRLYGGVKWVMIEHWSAYHYNFNIKSAKKKKRIQSVFKNNIPLVTVSDALKNDIENFVQKKITNSFILPNVVNEDYFFPKLNNDSAQIVGSVKFVTISNWAPVKQPFLILNAFAKLKLKGIDNFHLSVCGEGLQSKKMKEFVEKNDLSDCVLFLGNVPKSDLGNEIRKSDYLLHASKYETFSVVCAEALCCGVPVIASNVGGIQEVVNQKHLGVLVENTEEEWENVLLSVLKDKYSNMYDSKQISKGACSRFYSKQVGEKYSEMLKKLGC